MRDPEADTRRALRRRPSSDRHPRVVRALTAENDGRNRLDAVRWRVRLAATAARQRDRLAAWGVR